MTPEQHEKLAKLVNAAFDATELKRQVSYESREVSEAMGDRTGIDGAHFVVDELNRRNHLGRFLTRVLRERPDSDDLLQQIREVYPDIVSVGYASSQMSGNPAYKDLLDQSKKSLRKLLDSISLLRGYKKLHDCLHHLENGVLPLLGSSSRGLSNDPMAGSTLDTCRNELTSFTASIFETVASLPLDPPSIRSWERDWATRLQKSTNLANLACTLRSPDLGLQSAQSLRRIIRQEPARIERYLRITAESVNLDELAALFAKASVLTNDEELNGRINDARVTVESLTVRLQRFVTQHNGWQDIAAQLWDAEDYLPRTPFEEQRDFISYWKMLSQDIRNMITTNPNGALVAELFRICDDIDAILVGKQWESIRAPFEALRKNAGFLFLAMDGELLEITENIGKLRDSVKQLIP